MPILAGEEMISYFKYRTGYHLWLVNRWSNRIEKFCDNVPEVDLYLLNKERDEHDDGKWLAPEYAPYLYITWSYKCKREGVAFDVPAEIKEQMNIATYHHIKSHRHHPEFWDDKTTIKVLNTANRDAPADPVDGTKMPLTYVAAMCADWFAMSEELGTHPQAWADKNINVRWNFTPQQIVLIYKLIRDVWDKHYKEKKNA